MIAFGPILRALLVQPTHGRTQMVGPMLMWHATYLPECFLQAFGERLKGFTETQTGRFGVGVGQHQMIEHMRKRFAGNGDAKILHMRKIGLGPLTGRVLWLKNDLAFWSIHRRQLSDIPFQGAYFSWRRAI